MKIWKMAGMALLLSGMVLAHDVELEVEKAPNAVAVRFGYGHDDPARNAGVQVFAPGEAGKPYQTGSTDQRGMFVFAPDRAGEWRVVADDGEGHREEAKVTVGADGVVAMAESHGHDHGHEHSGLGMTWVTGLSVLLGVTGIALWWSGRRKPDAGA